MKKLILLSILVTALFNSCKKDRDEPIDPCDISNVTSSKIALGNYVDFNIGYISYDANGNPTGAINNDVFFEGLNIQAKNGAFIHDDGACNCLGYVKKNSNINYKVTASCEINHGYLVKLGDGSYARFYIAESIIGASSIEGYRVFWQYPYSNY